jgi:pimeloyl-ACP methyl ester carboxylesterase
MPYTDIRGAQIKYAVLGDQGPWVALSPGGRRGMEGVQSLGERIAKAGYRVLIHDRRNCGASDVAFDGSGSEYEVWADDLHELLSELSAEPAVIGGSSSGCRLSVLFALRYPRAVRSLLLWRVTGGRLAAERLAKTYYGDYIDAARRGGMAAVCETEHFSERIAVRPENRARLMATDPAQFIEVMAHWRQYFLDSIDLPIIGATETDLKSISVPVCIVPGNDNSHPRAVAENLHRILPSSELHNVQTVFHDADLGPAEDWTEKEAEMAAVFTDFLTPHVNSAALP